MSKNSVSLGHSKWDPTRINDVEKRWKLVNAVVHTGSDDENDEHITSKFHLLKTH